MMRSMPPHPPCPNGVTTRTRSARTRTDLKVEQTKIDFRYSGVYTQNQMPPLRQDQFSRMHLTGVMAGCRREPGEDDDVRLDARSGADMFLRSGRPWTAGFSGPAFVFRLEPLAWALDRAYDRFLEWAPGPPTRAKRTLSRHSPDDPEIGR